RHRRHSRCGEAARKRDGKGRPRVRPFPYNGGIMTSNGMPSASASDSWPPGRPAAWPHPAVEMRGIVKRFPGVVANDGVDLVVERGEIHALLGENGAGKSTLMNVLFGLYHPDEGEIRVDGKPVRFHGP